jgi:hypothetical protein
MTFFGALSISTLGTALGLGVFFFAHYFITGSFRPHLWAGFLSGFMVILGLLLSITGLLAGMLDRIRKNQEEIIYYERRKTIKSHP